MSHFQQQPVFNAPHPYAGVNNAGFRQHRGDGRSMGNVRRAMFNSIQQAPGESQKVRGNMRTIPQRMHPNMIGVPQMHPQMHGQVHPQMRQVHPMHSQVPPMHQAHAMAQMRAMAPMAQVPPMPQVPQVSQTHMSRMRPNEESNDKTQPVPNGDKEDKKKKHKAFEYKGYPSIPDRRWIGIRAPQMQQSHERFVRVVSLNVTCENDLMRNVLIAKKRNLPNRLKPRFAKWEHRGPLILEEIFRQNPDIICLQDVDHFQYFLEKLIVRGFMGIFERKRPLENRPIYVVSGLATFWRTDKFELVGRGIYPLGNPERVNNIALLTRLRRRDPHDPKRLELGEIDVWNAHLIKGNNEFRKLKQAKLLFQHLGRESHVELSNKKIDTETKPNTAPSVPRKREKVENHSMKVLKEQFRERMEKALEAKKLEPKEEKVAVETIEPKKEPTREHPSKKHLKRPVILCVDTSSDANVNRPHLPFSYCYLTHRSRTTDHNPMYQNVLNDRERREHEQHHNWFLQSAYALGFKKEIEFTCFFTNAKNGQTQSRASDLVLFSPQNFRVINLLLPLTQQWISRQDTRSLPCSNYPSEHFLIGVDFEIATPQQATPSGHHPSVSTSALPSQAYMRDHPRGRFDSYQMPQPENYRNGRSAQFGPQAPQSRTNFG